MLKYNITSGLWDSEDGHGRRYQPEFYQGRANHETFVVWQIDVLECEGHPPLLNWSKCIRTAPFDVP